MSPYSPRRLADDVLDVTWPVLTLSLLLIVGAALTVGSSARLFVTLVAVLVLPGYLLSLVAFPLVATREDDSTNFLRPDVDWGLSGLGRAERWAVAFGFSICLMPLYGLLIALAGLPYAVTVIVPLVVAVSTVLSVLALVRRRRLPADVTVPVRPGPVRFARSLASSMSHLSRANVVIVVTLLAALSTLAVGVTAPQADPAYTTASLLTESADGELVAAGYPYDLAPEEKADLVLVLTNDEGTVVDYNVVVQSEQVDTDGTVTRRKHLSQFSVQLRDGETWERYHQIAPLMAGDRVRLVYLVYRGSPPSEPTMDNAYRSLTLWVREPLPGETSQTEAAALTQTALTYERVQDHPLALGDTAVLSPWLTGTDAHHWAVR